MDNKVFWILLVGAILVVISLIGTVTSLLPPFLAPFVIVVYGLLILYMAR